MNYAQLYSLSSGQKIDKFHTFEKYYPLSFNDFIIFQPFSKPSKNYDYFDEVLSLIHPILEKNNIKIVQVGAKDEKPFNLCHLTQGTTSFGQLEYLISKSKLVLTVDSISAHLAGHYNIPLVDIVSNNYSQCVAPFFGDKSKQVIFEPDRTNKFPSFSLDEGPIKQVNEILPEKIAAAVCKLLNLEFSYPYRTLFLGKTYNQKTIESCMDSVINPAAINNNPIICRLDYGANLAVLIEQMKVGKVSIVSDKSIPINILQQFRPNIIEFIYEIKEENQPEFCKELQQIKLPYRLYSRLSEEKLNQIKLSYLDYQIITRLENKMPEQLKDKDLSNLFLKGAKFILSSKGIFNSYWAYKNNKSIPSFDSGPIKVDKIDPNLWVDADYNLYLDKISS